MENAKSVYVGHLQRFSFALSPLNNFEPYRPIFQMNRPNLDETI